MKNLDTNITNGKIQVKVPFELKDNFKKMFKTAKWNNWDKVWEIKDSKVSSNKLEKWISAVSEIVAEIEAIEEVEFTEQELADLKKEIETIKESISSVNETTVELKELNKGIKDSKTELEALKVDLAEAQAEKETEEEGIETFIDSLIDTSKLENISDTISDYAKKPFLRATEKDDLREELSYAHKAVKILEKAGYKSRNVSRLSNTTLSRLDRDNFEFSSKDFYDIEKIED